MILTKEQAAEIVFRPVASHWGDKASEKAVKKMCSYNHSKFIMDFRKRTGLMLCSFAPDKFYIRYEDQKEPVYNKLRL